MTDTQKHSPVVSDEQEQPAAWMVGWHRANGDAGVIAYVDEDDARQAAKNLETYSASETMTDVQPLYYAAPSPSPAASADTLDACALVPQDGGGDR